MQWLIPYIASSDRATSVWASREFLYDSNKSLIYYGDGATLGGIPLMTGSTAGVLPAISGSNGSFTYSTASFGNLNGISFYTSNGSLVASHNGITTAMASNAGSNFVWASASLHLTNVSATVQSNNISLSVAPPGAMSISGGTSSAALGSVVFTNANGVSFHLNGSTMSGSVKTDYIQTSQSSLFQHTSATSNITSNALNTSQSSLFQQTSLMTDYLGTAATQSFRHTSADTQLLFTSQSSLFQLTADNSLSLGTGYTTHTHSQYLNTSQSSLFQHTSNTSNITSNALNTSQSSLFEHTSHTTVFLTTQSNQAFSAANGSQTFQTIKFVDGQGVSFSTDTNGINATVRTDYQSSGNYLTTARASNDAIGLNTALTANGVSWTVNSSGLSLNVPAFLTTAMQSNQSSNFVNTSQSSLFQHTSATSNITSNALNTSQSSLFQATSLMSDYLTTAAKSNEVVNSINGSTGQFSFNTASSLSSSRNGNSISFGLASNITTALQSAGAYLTTARASNDGVGLNTAQSNVTWSVNSSGLSLDARGYAGTQTTFAGTNISASATLNSLGLNLALSANVGGGGGSINFSAGATSANLASVTFNDSNGVSFGLNAGTITATVRTDYQSSGNYLTTAALSNHSHNFATTTTNGSQIIVLTTNSVGATIGVPSFITTAMQSGESSNFVNTSQSSLFQHTSATSNITSNALNTSASSRFIQNWKLTGNTAGTTSSAQGSDLWLAGGNGVTISGSNNTLSFSVATNYQSQGAYLTTARASNDGIGLNTALTANGVSWTVNSSGLSLNVPAFLTTAMQSNQSSNFVNTSQSSLFQHTSATSAITSNAFPSANTTKFAGTGTTTAGTNISLSVTLNSNGLNLAASAGAGGGGSNDYYESTYVVWENDFISALWNNDDSPFTQRNSGTSSGVGGPTTGVTDNNHYGTITPATGTTTTGFGGFSSNNNTDALRPASGDIDFEVVIKTGTLSNVTDSYLLKFGLSDSNTALGNNSINIAYTHDTNSGAWFLQMNTGAVTRATINSSVTVAANTWYKLRFTMTGSSQNLELFIDGVSAGTATPSATFAIGTGVGIINTIIKSAGVTNRNYLHDFIRVIQKVSR